MTDRSGEECVPCRGGIPSLDHKAILDEMQGIEGWSLVDNHHITKKYEFKDFKSALDYVNKVGEISEKQGHHPDIKLGWGYMELEFFTHAINGLHVNDFIMAARCDRLLRDS